MTLSFKMIRNLGLAVLMLVIMSLGIISFVTTANIRATLSDIIKRHRPNFERVDYIRDLFDDVARKYTDYFKGEPEALSTIDQSIDKLIKIAGELKENEGFGHKNTIDAIIITAVDFKSALNAFLDEANHDPASLNFRESQKKLDQAEENLRESILDIGKHLMSDIKTADITTLIVATNGQKIIGVVMLMGIIAGFLAAFFMSRGLSIPLKSLIDVVHMATSQVDLTQQVSIKTNDEIGQLGVSFNSLIGTLRGIIFKIQEAGLQIASASNQIHSATQQQATGATEQSSAVNQASTTVKELATTAARIAENAENVSKTAERTLLGMQEINTKVDATAKKILSLDEKSQSIGNITKLIDDISKQTNLLALNAAIEAARAGETGKGFAIVAQEVRKLAERSAESTKDIRRLITEIQTETNSTIMGIEDSTKWVARGLEMIKETAQAAKEISIATQQQRSASEQTAQAMQSINAVTNQFDSSAHQVASSATQLSQLAQELKTSIGEFKLKKNET